MDTSDTIRLEWSELKKPEQLDPRTENVRGVYIWGFRLENEFLPYYVGIAENIYLRICEHIGSLLSGKYTVYKQSELKHFALHKIDGKGVIYQPNWPSTFPEFVSGYTEIWPHVQYMLKNLEYSMAAVPQSATISLKDIEKFCINSLGRNNLANTRSGNFDEFDHQHCGSPDILELFKKDNR